MNKVIFICGGHFSPAVAVIEALGKSSGLKMYYIGRKLSQEGDKSLSLEYREINKLDISFLEITTGKLNRFLSVATLLSLLKIPVGFVQSAKLLQKYRPDLVVSFGSYVALPVSVMAWFFRIPVITHEQTMVMGLSNRIISFFAKKVCLSFADTKKVPGLRKVKVTGMPLRNTILHPSDTGITEFGNKKHPLIFVTGGSQGSRAINSVISKVAPLLLKNYRLFHLCGESANLYDYHLLSRIRQNLDKDLRLNYFLKPSLDYNLMGEVMSKSELIISRSGANTVAEILYYDKPAILIPLPIAGGGEQLENARYLEAEGLSIIINQDRLKEKLLLSAIDLAITKKDQIQSRTKRDKNIDGKANLVLIISELLQK